MALKTQGKFTAQLHAKVSSNEFIIGGISIHEAGIFPAVEAFLPENVKIDFNACNILSCFARGKAMPPQKEGGCSYPIPDNCQGD